MPLTLQRRRPRRSQAYEAFLRPCPCLGKSLRSNQRRSSGAADPPVWPMPSEGPRTQGPAEVSTHRSPLSLFPKSQFFYCKVSRSNLFFSQLEVNYAHKPNFFLLGVLQYGGPCDASGEYPAISLKRMTQMTCCLFEHPL